MKKFVVQNLTWKDLVRIINGMIGLQAKVTEEQIGNRLAICHETKAWKVDHQPKMGFPEVRGFIPGFGPATLACIDEIRFTGLTLFSLQNSVTRFSSAGYSDGERRYKVEEMRVGTEGEDSLQGLLWQEVGEVSPEELFEFLRSKPFSDQPLGAETTTSPIDWKVVDISHGHDAFEGVETQDSVYLTERLLRKWVPRGILVDDSIGVVTLDGLITYRGDRQFLPAGFLFSTREDLEGILRKEFGVEGEIPSIPTLECVGWPFAHVTNHQKKLEFGGREWTADWCWR